MQATQALDTKFTTDIASANAAIQNEAAARSTADSAQAQQISALDTKFTTGIASANAAIQSEATARASADTALSSSINTVQSSLNGTTATVQQHSQAIVNLQNGAQAMWTVKAQAGDIQAGIGLIADSATGKSQVLVNASQFFVFDNAVGKTAIFAIDQGQVIIREAVIRKATVSILNSETITATNVKAGQAGFGPGGSYSMFGANWYTTISSDGTLRTSKLQAAGGNISAMTIGNCTITGDCDVQGTIYANKLVGDVTKMMTNKGGFTIAAYGKARNLIMVQGGITFRRRVSGSGTVGFSLNVYLNGVLVETATTTMELPTGGSFDMMATIQPYMTIPANTTATISFTTSTTGSGSFVGPEYNITDRAVWLLGLA